MVSVLKQLLAVVTDTFTWSRFDSVEVARVDRALGFRVGSVELVPQRDPHLDRIFHTAELFLDRIVEGKSKEGFGVSSSLLEIFDSALKVGIINLTTSGPSGVGRSSFGRLLFFTDHDFPRLY